MRYWKPGDIYEIACPNCGRAVEFFKDETTRRCKGCGEKVANPKIDFGCAAYCQYAAACLGEIGPELAALREGPLGARPAPAAKELPEGVRKTMKVKRKIIEIDEERCTGCGECVSACAEGALAIIDGKARLVSENYCDGLGACLGECPEGALKVTERDSEIFDAQAAEEHVKAAAGPAAADAPQPAGTMPCGCPSSEVRVFPSAVACAPKQAGAAEATPPEAIPSALGHWPVQIRLIPANASFLKNADLLIAADCTPLAYAGFHRDLLPGKVVMLGCPKFDDVAEYTSKFTEIFRTAGIRSITVVEMEVPCCSRLPAIVKTALLRAGKEIPIEEVVISRMGKMVHRAVAHSAGTPHPNPLPQGAREL
jgi:ferredoxin